MIEDKEFDSRFLGAKINSTVNKLIQLLNDVNKAQRLLRKRTFKDKDYEILIELLKEIDWSLRMESSAMQDTFVSYRKKRADIPKINSATALLENLDQIKDIFFPKNDAES